MRALLLAAALLAQPVRVQVAWHESRAATLARQHRYAAAAAELLAANRLVPTRDRLIDAARLLERDHQPAAAFELYGQAGAEGEQERLARSLAIVEVESDPPGAAIFVDREALGVRAQSPARLALPPGEHEIHANLEGYEDALAAIEATAGTRRGVRLRLAPSSAELRVESTPTGAEVVIDGRLRPGRTPASMRIASGEHEIEVRSPGRLSRHRHLVLAAGERRLLALALPPEPRADAGLVVESDPPASLVKLDGRVIGHAPLVTRVRPGRRRITISAVGRESAARVATLDEGRMLALDARLAPRPGLPPALWLLGFAAVSATAGLALAFDEDTRAPAVALTSLGIGTGSAGIVWWALWDPPRSTIDSRRLEEP